MNQTATQHSGPVFVVALDFSPRSHLALRAALQVLARIPGASVHVVSVDPNLHFPRKFGNRDEVREFVKAQERLALAMQSQVGATLDEHSARNQTARPDRVAVHARFGDPADEIVALAAALDADMIFVGTRGREGLGRVLLGSVAEKVVRTAGCPVQVVRERCHPKVEDPVEEIEPPPRPYEHTPSLERRHTYHYVPRHVERQPNYPLVYQDAVPRTSL